MKAKTIRKVLRAKVDEWLATIEDEALRDAARRDAMVTGGAIASMLLREPVNDFDVYLRTKETAAALARYYVERFRPKDAKGVECAITVEERDDRVSIYVKSTGIASEGGTAKPYEYFEASEDGAAGEYVGDVMTDPGEIEDVHAETEAKALDTAGGRYRPVFMTTNAITLSDRIQIVIRFFGEPDDIHENYDFVHCTNYWRSADGKLVLRPDALEALLARELRYVGSKYPVCSMFRLRKFLARGWSINAGQILKMALQVSALDLMNFDVLRDQLTGVDCAYFAQVLQRMTESDPEKIDRAYLVEIIDRMF